mmetsp:Transcript_36297/g.103746  ORF Transcript_36297/g.103746 Transcript_36297/m.103746 type:complete len:504 (+) Transcript_36297:99-1610(+)
MLQGVLRAQALVRIHDQHLVQEIGHVDRLLDVLLVLVLLRLRLLGPHALEDQVLHVALRVEVREGAQDLLARDLVVVLVFELQVLVEMLLPHCALLDHLDGHLALEVHDLLQLVVVGLAREQRPSREDLIQCAAEGPDVHPRAVVTAEDDLRRPVEAAHEVGRRGDVLQLHRGAEIAQLDNVVPLADQDVVRLDIRVNNLVLVHVPNTIKQLLCVHSNSLQRHAFVLGVLLHRSPEVVPHALEHKENVLPVVERLKEPDDVLLVLLVAFVEPLEDLDLLLRRLLHHVVGTDDLDGDVRLTLLFPVLCLHNIGENTATADGLVDNIPVVQDLADLGKVVTLLVVPVLARGAGEADRGRLAHAALERGLGPGARVEHVACGLLLLLGRKDEVLDLALLRACGLVELLGRGRPAALRPGGGALLGGALVPADGAGQRQVAVVGSFALRNILLLWDKLCHHSLAPPAALGKLLLGGLLVVGEVANVPVFLTVLYLIPPVLGLLRGLG